MTFMKKTLTFTASVLCLIFSISSVQAFAKTNDIDNVNKNYTVKAISKEEIPSNITPKEFENEEQAQAYYESIIDNLHNTEASVSSINLRSYNGSRYASKKLLPPLNTVHLYMNVGYRAEWNSSIGNHYASADIPTTAISGVTLGLEWVENKGASYSNISSSKHSLSAHGVGTLNQYLLIKGLLKVYSSTQSIDATWGQP